VSVVVGVDGAGRTYRLEALAAASNLPVMRLAGSASTPAGLDQKLAAGTDRVLVLVDDAHRLPVPALLALTEAVRSGQAMLLSRRPTIDRPELAELDEALAAVGRVELLTALDQQQVAGLVAAVTGRPCPDPTAAAIREASGGLPAVAAALAAALGGGLGPPPVLLARLQRRVAVLSPLLVGIAYVLALRLDLPDDALAQACGLEPLELEAGLRALRDEGMLVPGTERMVPAIAASLLTEVSPGHRRRIHDDVARALVTTGAPALTTAIQLRSVRARGAEAASAYRAAGEKARFTDPGAALGWYDDAQDAGAAGGSLAAGRAEAGALLGMPVELDAAGLEIPEPAAGRIAVVAGIVAAHQGRADRAGSILLAAGTAGPALATLVLIGAGRLEAAVRAAAAPAPSAVALLAAAAVAGTDPSRALPLAIEAAEAIEAGPVTMLLPDTPHALAAVLAVVSGEVATAVHQLERAQRYGVGGPVSADRHRLLLAWAQLRAGRLEAAREAMRPVSDADLGGRDRMLLAAVRAGLARRSGDIAVLRQTWPEVERVLARRSPDLFQLEATEELAVAAVRLRRGQRLAPTLAALEEIVRGLGSPPTWTVSLGWLHLQVAVAMDDPVAATVAAEGIAAAGIAAGSPLGPRQLAQQAAAPPWAAALAGEVDPEAVLAATDGLAGAELPWEASRLAGDAAIRVTSAATARRLLERARELTAPEPAPGRSGKTAQQAGLSDREIEVGALVLAGRTHREIGAQLYIAPKTVEHHVARIRTKLGATTRAEFVAALQAVLGAEPPAGSG